MNKSRLKLVCLLVAVCFAFCGCNLVRTDPAYVAQLEAEQAAAEQAAYEADMANVVATYYGDRAVTKGEVYDTFVEQYYMYYYYMQYMNYMYSMFGLEEVEMTLADVQNLRDQVIAKAVKDRVLDQKLLDFGLEAITKEEKDGFTAEAKSDYAAALAQFKSQGYADSEVEAAALMSGVSENTLYSSKYDKAVKSKLYPIATKDVTITDAEVQAKYETLLEEAKSASASDVENSLNDGETVYYIPDGLRHVNHILLTPADGLMDALSAAQTAVSEKETAIAALTDEAEISAAEAELAELQAKSAEAEKAVWDSVNDNLTKVQQAIAGGEDFNALVRAYSQDNATESAFNGYYIYEGSNKWDAAFLKAAFSIAKVGDVSEPILSSYGVHLIKYDEALKAGEVSFADAKAELEAETLTEKQDEAYDAAVSAWVAEADAKYDVSSWKIQ